MAPKSKTTKAKTKTSAPVSDAVFFARLFDLIAAKGWLNLTLPMIAKGTKIPLKEVIKTYPDKHAMLAGFARMIDAEVAGMVTEENAPLKERLFEVIMLRLDALKPYRAGAIRLMDELQARPDAALALGLEAGCQLRRSVKLMLDLAGAEPAGMLAEPLHLGVKLIYLQTLRTWKNDASPDLGVTMAILDKWLDRLVRLFRLA